MGQIARHYRAGMKTVARWLADSGVERGPVPKNGWPQRDVPDDFKEVARRLTHKQLREHYDVGSGVLGRWLAEAAVDPRRATFRTTQPGMKALIPHRDVSREGQAAEFLQRFGPVFRSDAEGNPHPKGTHWRRGSFVLTGEEIVERAVRNGWDPNAWRRVA